MNLASKLPNTETTIFTVMSALAQKHGAINLSQGFPDFKSDNALITLVSEAMQAGYNQYAPMAGRLDLRNAIANKYHSLYSQTYNAETEITITAGATQAIYTIISALVKPNDEVIIFKPAYDCYEPAVTINGGKTIGISLQVPDYSVNWDLVREACNSKTKLIIINSPHNPTGILWTANDMLQLQAITKNTDIVVLSDEVYEHIIFEGNLHQSACLFPNLKRRSFIVASFGKTFHNTGWKMGYCCAPNYLMRLFRDVHQFNVFCVNHPMQKALATYLQTPKHYLGLASFYQKKRDLFLSLIKSSRFKIVPTQGTYFQLLDYSNITRKNDVEVAKWLTETHKIASIPLSVFNVNKRDDKLLRFCFAKTEETLIKAAKILNTI